MSATSGITEEEFMKNYGAERIVNIVVNSFPETYRAVIE